MAYLHPRRAKYQRFWERAKARQRRLPAGVLTTAPALAERPLWGDYYPWAPGTVAEKMIFAELALRRVTFFFGPYWGDVPFTTGKKEHYRPDFVLPEYRIVIEVYGSYWHTQEHSAEKDAIKAAMYTASGYTYYKLWDYEIFAGARDALNQIPELVNPTIKTGKIFLSDRPLNPAASLAAQRRKYPKVLRLKSGTRRLGTGYKPHLRAPRTLREDRAPGFRGLGAEQTAELEGFGTEWKEYVEGLGTYFAGNVAGQQAYRKQYRYYLRWKDYWNRWQLATQTTPQWRAYIKTLGGYFGKYPSAWGHYQEEYYRWLSWRRVSYRRR